MTDALGRTADFTNAIIVLTSNLGVREAEGHVGLRGPSDAARGEAFVRAGERFFRPEFFNRLDRVIPFRRLTRAEVAKIAELLLADVFAREGLTQRKCILRINPATRDRVVDHGFDPDLGARALKRSIERFLTKPLAARLSALRPDHFTVVRLFLHRGEIDVHVRALEQVTPREADQGEIGPAILPRIDASLKEIEAAVAPLRPTGPVSPGTMRPEHFRYFALRELLDPLRERWRELDEEQKARRTPELRVGAPRMPGQRVGGKVFSVMRNFNPKAQPQLREIAKSENIDEFIRDLVEQARPEGNDAAVYTSMRRQLVLLRAMLAAAKRGLPDRVLLSVTAPAGPSEMPERLGRHYAKALSDDLGLETAPLEHHAHLLVRGLAAMPLLDGEIGSHLISGRHERLELLQVQALPVPDGIEPAAVLTEWRARQATWLDDLQAGRADIDADPAPLGSVVRLYESQRGVDWFSNVLDFRTGLVNKGQLEPEFLQAALVEGLLMSD